MPLTLQATKSKPAADQRDTHIKAAKAFFERAREQAGSGQVMEAGSLILKGLEQERRAGAIGPQVLQLIKPRT